MKWKQIYGLSATFTCPYCLREFPLSKATKDHIVPKSRGGLTVPENLINCCRSCNSQKGALTPEEYEEWKTTDNEERWEFLEFIRHGGLSNKKER